MSGISKMLIASISISLGFPFLLLYSRKKEWCSQTVKNLLFIGMSILSLVGFYLSDTNNYRFLFYAFMTIPIYLLVDYVFKFLSIKIHKRDFYLWMRFSDDIDDSFSGFGKNKHVKITDMIFSIFLLVLILGLCVLGAVLFGKDALYDKLIN